MKFYCKEVYVKFQHLFHVYIYKQTQIFCSYRVRVSKLDDRTLHIILDNALIDKGI